MTADAALGRFVLAVLEVEGVWPTSKHAKYTRQNYRWQIRERPGSCCRTTVGLMNMSKAADYTMLTPTVYHKSHNPTMPLSAIQLPPARRLFVPKSEARALVVVALGTRDRQAHCGLLGCRSVLRLSAASNAFELSSYPGTPHFQWPFGFSGGTAFVRTSCISASDLPIGKLRLVRPLPDVPVVVHSVGGDAPGPGAVGILNGARTR